MAGPYGRGYFPQQKKSGNRVNNEIRSPQVRLIDTDGAQLGIKSIAEALFIARGKQLDLVEVAPQAQPPVCRILAYSKFKYEQEKKERESRKHQKAGMLKEVRFSPVIGPHDLDVKLRHAEEFLKAHDKVRFTVVFRGRQNQHQEIGQKLLISIKERFAAIAITESDFAKERNRLSITLAPKK
jgi:translation initiation factor IF-3